MKLNSAEEVEKEDVLICVGREICQGLEFSIGDRKRKIVMIGVNF